MRVLSRYRFTKKEIPGQPHWASLECECYVCGYHWVALYPILGYRMELYCPKCQYPVNVTHEDEGIYE